MQTQKIATEEFPIRASSLPELLECPAKVLIPHMNDDSAATQMGSLVHEGAEAFHNGQDGEAAIEAARVKFPLGDQDTAKKHFAAYIADPRNNQGNVVHNENQIRCRIPDPQGGPDIVISGTLDQVRLIDGRYRVCDIKTGKNLYGKKAVYHYAAQQAAYTVGARQTYGLEVHPGFLICTDGYFRRNGEVFWDYEKHGWNYSDCELLLETVANILSSARRGRIGVAPSEHNCQWCPFHNPETCFPLLRKNA